MTHSTQPRPASPGAVARMFGATTKSAITLECLSALERAGLALRSIEAAGGDPDEALGRIDPGAIASAASVCTSALCARRVREAAEEAFEACLPDGDAPAPDEAWSEAAMEALDLRDGLCSIDAALGRLVALRPDRRGELTAVREQLATICDDMDVELRASMRCFLALGPKRRARLDALRPDERESAYWYSERAACDDILRLLAGANSDGEHARHCPQCQSDLRATSAPLDAARGVHRSAP